MHRPPTEGNFCDEQGKAKTPVSDYNWHMGYVAKGKEWLTAIQLVVKHGNGEKKKFYVLDLLYAE
jgi:hypothetical protein